MKRSLKIVWWTLFFIAVFVAAVLLTRWYYQFGKVDRREEATILLERIQAVTRLVVLDGYFSEIYDYKDHYGFDLSFFRKKALIRVQAKVSIGYNLEHLNVRVEENTRTVYMSALPPPEILSIDHNLDYYDLQQGLFNSFSPQDYTRLNEKAKDFVRKKALDSELYTLALQRRDDIYTTIRFLVESMGWQLVIGQTPATGALDTLRQ